MGVCVSRFTLDIGVPESCALACRPWAISWEYASAGEYGGSSGLAAATGTGAAAQVVVERFARGGHWDGGPGVGGRRRGQAISIIFDTRSSSIRSKFDRNLHGYKGFCL